MATTLELKADKAKLPSDEQAVVEEFAAIIRKHLDNGPATIARLMNLAFGVSLGRSGSREDKLARAFLRGMEVRQQITEAEGGSLSSEETARLLKISKTAVMKRLESGKLLAWREERLQAARFPQWQFDQHGLVLRGLEDVLAVLNQDERLDAWGKLLFFLQEKPGLGDLRPLDLLRQGKLAEVQQAAARYVE